MAIEDNTRFPRPAHNYVPEYQQSGIPWVKTIALPKLLFEDINGNDLDENQSKVAGTFIKNIDDFKVSFDFVTRWFSVQNHDDAKNSDIRIYFNRTAARSGHNSLANQDPHYYRCDIEEILPRLELKCKEIYIIPEVYINNGGGPVVAITAALTNIRSLDFPDQTKENGFTGVEN